MLLEKGAPQGVQALESFPCQEKLTCLEGLPLETDPRSLLHGTQPGASSGGGALPHSCPLPLQLFAPFELIRYDVLQEAPQRDEAGRCQSVKPGEHRPLWTGLLPSPHN